MASENPAGEQEDRTSHPLDASDADATPTTHNDDEVAYLVQQLPQLLDTAGEARKQLQREKETLAEEVKALADEAKALERDVVITGGGMFVAGVVFGIAFSLLGHEWMLKRMK